MHTVAVADLPHPPAVEGSRDVKDYWWHLDAVPSHAWNRWRYHHPQAVPAARAAWIGCPSVGR